MISDGDWGGGGQGRLTKHQEMNCIHDVELDTTLHSKILDRTIEASSGREAMLRGTWTRIWGKGWGGRDNSWSRDSGQLAQLAGSLFAGLGGSVIGFGEQTSLGAWGVAVEAR